MKKILIVITIIMALGFVGHFEHYYTRGNCVVKYADEGQAIITDCNGHEWLIERPEQRLYRNDVVILKMHDNYTNNIKDDVIIKVIKK